MHDTVEHTHATGKWGGGTLTNLRCFVLDRCLVRRFSRRGSRITDLSMDYPPIICIVLRFGGNQKLKAPFSNDSCSSFRFPSPFPLSTLSFASPLLRLASCSFFFSSSFLIHELNTRKWSHGPFRSQHPLLRDVWFSITPRFRDSSRTPFHRAQDTLTYEKVRRRDEWNNLAFVTISSSSSSSFSSSSSSTSYSSSSFSPFARYFPFHC